MKNPDDPIFTKLTKTLKPLFKIHKKEQFFERHKNNKNQTLTNKIKVHIVNELRSHSPN